MTPTAFPTPATSAPSSNADRFLNTHHLETVGSITVFLDVNAAHGRREANVPCTVNVIGAFGVASAFAVAFVKLAATGDTAIFNAICQPGTVTILVSRTLRCMCRYSSRRRRRRRRSWGNSFGRIMNRPFWGGI